MLHITELSLIYLRMSILELVYPEKIFGHQDGGKKKALLTDQDALLESPCMERYICGFLKIKIPHSVTHQRIYSWQRKDSFISSCEWQNVSYHSMYLLPHYLILSRTLLVLNCLFTNSVNVKEQWLANVVN